MTDKIIIDGVNVAECEHHLSTGYCQLQMIFQGMLFKLPFGKHLECNLCDKTCYYKQLKQLEQEHDELRASNKNLKLQLETYNLPEIQKVLTDWRTGELDLQKKKLDELKQENERLKRDYIAISQASDKLVADAAKMLSHKCEPSLLSELSKQRDKYRKTLEYIRDMVDCKNCKYDDCNVSQCDRIENKINEVLNNVES